MPFSFFTKKRKNSNQTYLSLDVGTEFVKTVIFDLAGNKVNVRGVGRVRQPISAVKNGQVTNVKNVVDTSKSAIEKATLSIQSFPPTDVAIGVAGELVRGIPVVVNYNREKPEEKITFDEVSKVMDKIQEMSMQEARKIFVESTGKENPLVKPINTTVVDAYIDEYRVETPIGFPGKAVKLTIYTTYAPLIHIGALDSVAKALKLHPILISAEPFAVARSLKGAREENFESIIIDVGGGTTDIAIVKKGGVVDTHMIAFGGRVFTKRIAQEMNIDYDKAEKMKIDYSNNGLERPIANIVKKAVSKDMHLWITGVELALKEFTSVKVFPSTILLCGGGSLLPEIKDALIQHPWTDVLQFERVPKVVFLKPENIDSINDPDGLAMGIDMVTPLSLARLVLDLQDEMKGA
jgi:cell division protein FtsA